MTNQLENIGEQRWVSTCEEQGWSPDSQQVLLGEFIRAHHLYYALAEFAQKVADAENNTPATNDELRNSLSWIVSFCNEHPEWFGEGRPDEGAEFEWLKDACALLARPN